MRRETLLLQGPIGPFFARFGADLESRGFTVTKINFNGGDRFFYRRAGAVDYAGTLAEWEAWLERLVVNRGVGRIYVFGDCRAYHRIARDVARRNGIRLFVFEEGYIRPNFITLEEDGVNGYSPMMERPVSLTSPHATLPEEVPHPGRVFAVSGFYSMLYYWSSAAARGAFPHYHHHRPFEWFAEGARWLRSGIRKWRYSRRDRHIPSRLANEFAGNYFVCPLQVHCDMQVVVHSDFNSIEHFIGEVLASFRQAAPSNAAIVFKHHPMDRGYTDYTTLLTNLVAELGLAGRVFYVHDPCLPSLLRDARGTVLINSTVGMSSLFHGTPVKTLGKAVYDLPGLTWQGTLDQFWNADEPVDAASFQAFRNNLVVRNQLNGNFYRRLSPISDSGIVWSAHLDRSHTFDAARSESGGGRRFTVIDGGAPNPSTVRRGDDAEAA